MSGYSFAEKLLAKKVGRVVRAGEMAIVDVDIMMGSDTTMPIAMKAFQEMNGKTLFKPNSTIVFIDHATPCPNEHIAQLHKLIRKFCEVNHAILYDQNYGVCHQVMIEQQHVKQGDLVLGADSHTCSYGAVGAFSIGVGSTDLAAAMLTGKTWIRVPQTIRIELEGKLQKGVYAKDVILKIIGDITESGATYMAIEYAGEGFECFSLDEAMTVCNMSVEMGAKSGVFVPALTDPDLMPDPDTEYVRILKYRAEDIEPMVSCPHTVDNVKTVPEVQGKKVDLVYIGSCTNARLSDFAVVSQILSTQQLAEGVRMIVAPSSTKVLCQAIDQGYIQTLLRAGAIILPAGCGLCVGTLGGVPGNEETVISTTNRNFLGRMGNSQASIYLSSPAVAAASALTGKITDPRSLI